MFPFLVFALAWFLFYGKQSITLFFALSFAMILWAAFTLAWFMGNYSRFYFGPENIVLGTGFLIFFHAVLTN